MQESKSTVVTGPNGLIGFTSETPDLGGSGDQVRIVRTDGFDIVVRRSDLQLQTDGSYFLPLTDSRISSPPAAGLEETVIPVIAEELVVEKRQVPTGGVRVHKLVQQHEEVVSMLLRKDHVDIRRVIVGRDVDGPMPIRREGEVIIIPVVEEVFVVEKRMRLKEELHIRRCTTEEQSDQTVTLQRETAVVERLDANGQATREEIPAQPVNAVRVDVQGEARPLRRNKILKEE